MIKLYPAEIDKIKRLIHDEPLHGYSKESMGFRDIESILSHLGEFIIQDSAPDWENGFSRVYFIPTSKLEDLIVGTTVKVFYLRNVDKMVFIQITGTGIFPKDSKLEKIKKQTTLDFYSEKINDLFERVKDYIVESDGISFDDSQYNQLNLLLIAAYRRGWEDGIEAFNP